MFCCRSKKKKAKKKAAAQAQDLVAQAGAAASQAAEKIRPVAAHLASQAQELAHQGKEWVAPKAAQAAQLAAEAKEKAVTDYIPKAKRVARAADADLLLRDLQLAWLQVVALHRRGHAELHARAAGQHRVGARVGRHGADDAVFFLGAAREGDVAVGVLQAPRVRDARLTLRNGHRGASLEAIDDVQHLGGARLRHRVQ